jgi:hypothetical protein
MVRRSPTRGRAEARSETPLFVPEFRLALSGGALAGQSFVIRDWPYDTPPGIVWLAEVDGEIVGHVPDKAILNAVAALEARGLPGWTPYERAAKPYRLGELADPVEGVFSYVWAQRMDPNAREPRHLHAVAG